LILFTYFKKFNSFSSLIIFKHQKQLANEESIIPFESMQQRKREMVKEEEASADKLLAIKKPKYSEKRSKNNFFKLNI